jgi:putative endonuclease
MICFVYIIGSKTKIKFGNFGSFRTYVGWTNDLDNRLKAHNAGIGAKSTRGRHWELLYAERHDSRSEAMSREWRLKKDRKFRNNLRDLFSDINSLH